MAVTATRRSPEGRCNMESSHTEVSVPARIWGLDANGKAFNQTAIATDLTDTTAVLAGITAPLNPDDIIGIQVGPQKSRFRIHSINGGDGPYAATVESLEPDRCIWKVQMLAALGPRYSAADQGERRRTIRYPCNGGADFRRLGEDFAQWGRVTDLSEFGCYVETMSPFQPGEELDVILTFGDHVFRAHSVACTAHQHVGMGLRFKVLTSEDLAKLREVLQPLAAEFMGDPAITAQVLSHIQRILSCVRELDEIVRISPQKIVPGLPEHIGRLLMASQAVLDNQRRAIQPKTSG